MTRSVRPKRDLRLLLALTLAGLAGCSEGVETDYGRSRAASINGTGVLLRAFRDRGHETRAAVRLTETLSEWADVIVRVAQVPGPPGKEEAAWYDNWLQERADRRVIFIARNYDARPDYWQATLDGLPADAAPRLRERLTEALNLSRTWYDDLPPHVKHPADPDEWFAVEPSPKGKPAAPVVAKKLQGPWAAGVDAAKVAVVVREPLKVNDETVLLSADGAALAMSWEHGAGGRVLAVANASFLLNAALAVRPARWPLATRVVDWAGFDGDEDEGETGPFVRRRVAFVEGRNVLSDGAKNPSVFDLLWVEPFGKVAAQVFLFGLAACLAIAPRLGRPRPSEPSGAERPAANPEALGALLARAGNARDAREVLEFYRRWRARPASRGRPNGRTTGGGP